MNYSTLGGDMSVWAMDLNAEVATSLVAAAATVGVAGIAASVARRSTDQAEARYRKSLDSNLVSAFESALRRDDGDIVEAEIVESEPAEATVHRVEDEARRRLAALPVDYHAQVLAQSRQSFIFSLGAAVVGFFIVAVSIMLVLADQIAPGIASMVGAVLAEVVAALFFQQSNRARALMSGQLDGFRQAEEADRRSRERRDLIELVVDTPTRDDLITQTVLRLADQDRYEALPAPASPAE